jgi:hypothetical protein
MYDIMSCVHVIGMYYESLSTCPCDHTGVADCDTIMEGIEASIMERINALLKRNQDMICETLHDRSVDGRG